jgi:hypothetical protein
MALIDTLGEIGNAIREKTGGTELIPLKEMASVIRGIETENQTTIQNPLEYATKMDGMYLNAVFPDGYEIVVNAPKIKSLNRAFMQSTGVKKITVKGNVNGDKVDFTEAFRNTSGFCTVEEIDLSNFIINLSKIYNCFYGAKTLKVVKGEIDMSNVTTAENVFVNCEALEEIRFKPLSIYVSINVSPSSKLSVDTVKSIIDGLATVTTAQTLTLNNAIVLTDEQKSTINAKGWTLAQ